MDYEIYPINSGIPLANVPQPQEATWERIERGTFADGSARFALGKVVQWTYARAVTAAQFQALTIARPANGKVKVKTWKKPTGGVAASSVMCTAVMAEPSGVLIRGEYQGVSVRFTQVQEI